MYLLFLLEKWIIFRALKIKIRQLICINFMCKGETWNKSDIEESALT